MPTRSYASPATTEPRAPGIIGAKRPRRCAMFKYSLVGYDGSSSSRRAFQLAMALARTCGGRVRVVSVLQVTEGGADACTLMMADSSAQRAQELLEELTAVEADAAALVD